MVCTFRLPAWFLLAPHTLLSDTAFVFALGSGLDVAFNANPLLKLDGYYLRILTTRRLSVQEL